MPINTNSPLQGSGNYYVNDPHFDGQLFFTEVTGLNLIIVRYDDIDSTWKVIYNAKLSGYDNGTVDLDYRIDLNKHIQFTNITKDLTFTMLDGDENIQYTDLKTCKISIFLKDNTLFNILDTYISLFTVKSNGELWISDTNLSTLKSQVMDYSFVFYDKDYSFVFYDKVDDSEVVISNSDVVKQGSWLPISTFECGDKSDVILEDNTVYTGTGHIHTYILDEPFEVLSTYTVKVGIEKGIGSNTNLWTNNSGTQVLTVPTQGITSGVYIYPGGDNATSVSFYSETSSNPSTIYYIKITKGVETYEDFKGRNYQLNSMNPKWLPNDAGFGEPTVKNGYTTITPDVDKSASVFNTVNFLVDSTKSYTASCYVGHNHTSAINIGITRLPDYLSKLTIVQPGVWTQIDSYLFTGVYTGNLVVLAYNAVGIPIDIKQLKFEEGTTMTPWTPALQDYDNSLITYDDKNIILNQLNLNTLTNKTYLNYIPKDATQYYINSPEKKGFFPITSNCSNQLFYQSINGGLDMIYTTGNEHEVENTTKEYITVKDKKLPIKLITNKQVKVNTGYGLNQEQVYSLVKSPYIYKTTNTLLPDYVGRNLLINTPLDEYEYNVGATDGYSFPFGFVSLSDYGLVGGDRVTFSAVVTYLDTITSYAIKVGFNNGVSTTYEVGSPVNVRNRNSLTVDIPLDTLTIGFYYSFVGQPNTFNLKVKEQQLEIGSVVSPYNHAPEDLTPNPLLITTKRYMLNTNTFEGYNGSKLSEKNIELILEDEKQYRRKTNIQLGFYE